GSATLASATTSELVSAGGTARLTVVSGWVAPDMSWPICTASGAGRFGGGATAAIRSSGTLGIVIEAVMVAESEMAAEPEGAAVPGNCIQLAIKYVAGAAIAPTSRIFAAPRAALARRRD